MTKKLQSISLLFLSFGFFCKVSAVKTPELNLAIKHLKSLKSEHDKNNNLREKLGIIKEEFGGGKNLADLEALQSIVKKASEKENKNTTVNITLQRTGVNLDGTSNIKAIIQTTKDGDDENEGKTDKTEVSLKLNIPLLADNTEINFTDAIDQLISQNFNFSEIQKQYRYLQMDQNTLNRDLKVKVQNDNYHLGKPGTLLRSWNDNKLGCKGLVFGLGAFFAAAAFMSTPGSEEIKVNADGSTRVTKKMSPRQKFVAAVGSVLATTAILSSRIGKSVVGSGINLLRSTREAIIPNVDVNPSFSILKANDVSNSLSCDQGLVDAAQVLGQSVDRVADLYERNNNHSNREEEFEVHRTTSSHDFSSRPTFLDINTPTATKERTTPATKERTTPATETSTTPNIHPTTID